MVSSIRLFDTYGHDCTKFEEFDDNHQLIFIGDKNFLNGKPAMTPPNRDGSGTREMIRACQVVFLFLFS